MKQTIALNAIRGITYDTASYANVQIIETLRALKFSTDEAVELRQAVSREWMTTEPGYGREILSLAKVVVNQYVRDYSLR